MNNSEALRPLMIVGTGSDVGKSVITAAFCRIFKQEGYHPAPFKAQNMSLNSYATPDGLEIGRAQAMQAEACGIDCCSDMNPVLLKPNDDRNAQVVLHGKPIGNRSARDYFLKTDRDQLFQEALSALQRLRNRYNPIVMEGAGSISEINLWDKDITNMRMALAANAAVILVADIDRGGVFGSVFGTMQLLPPEQRVLVKGVLINKFRGDRALFEEGQKMLEDLVKIPVVGVVPWFNDIVLDEEDSVRGSVSYQPSEQGSLNVAVVLLRHMSNFTDFRSLERIPGIHLYYAACHSSIERADVIVLPGSKNTISDMQYLRESGLDQSILRAHKDNKAVYGICGGYQMMGQEIHDSGGVEGDSGFITGLGILPVSTEMTSQKTTEQAAFRYRQSESLCKGYEIHMGHTTAQSPSPLCILQNGKADGYFRNAKTWGTYLHGIFDNETVIRDILHCNGVKEIPPVTDFRAFKETQYDALARLVQEHVDMDYLFGVMQQ